MSSELISLHSLQQEVCPDDRHKTGDTVIGPFFLSPH